MFHVRLRLCSGLSGDRFSGMLKFNLLIQIHFKIKIDYTSHALARGHASA